MFALCSLLLNAVLNLNTPLCCQHGIVDVAQCGAILTMAYTLLKLAAYQSKKALQTSSSK